VLRKKLRRGQVLEFFAKLEPTKIGLEACGGSHYWARELRALGHEVVLLPPQYVKPYVKRNKNDAADAEAICEAMSRPTMRFVPVKTPEQQAALMLAGTRDGLIGRRTQLSNTIRGYAAEFGLTAAKGLDKIEPLLARVAADEKLPKLAKELFAAYGRDYAQLQRQIATIQAKLMAWHKDNELSRRLVEVPSIGPIGGSLLAMKVTDPHAFRSGRDFSAWIGLTPKDHSTAGKKRLGAITRAGDEALRSVLVAGATAVIQQVQKGRAHGSPWLVALLKRKPPKLAAVALANKMARVAWKLMVSGERYNPARIGVTATAAAREGRGAALRGGSAPRPSLASRSKSREATAMINA
jgi:transposase